jgi:hypothetical protein
LEGFGFELGVAVELMTLKTFVAFDWCVSFCVWVMLSCDRVGVSGLGLLCVVLGISYLLKFVGRFRFV